ncbi:hypothetical protein FQR65_LT00104 [Abscondita terminalis]|nr:hypothetical protein FQR65_LT00104 [Abscondita terminalis]
MNIFIIINTIIFITFGVFNLTHAVDFQVRNLLQGITNSISRSKHLQFVIHCYAGKPKTILYIWQTVLLEIDLESDNYEYYEGSTPEIVRDKYIQHHSSWNFNILSWKQKSIRLDPFNSTCIGIETREPYMLLLQIIRVDYWKILILILGITLFFTASRLSKNALFYYICGITFGMCASFLILIYFISKLFPKRPVMYGVAICGWTIGVIYWNYKRKYSSYCCCLLQLLDVVCSYNWAN